MRTLKTPEGILDVLMALASLLVAGLHTFGVLDTTWAAERVPIITLVIVGLTAGYLGFGSSRSFDELSRKVDTAVQQILAAASGAVVQQFTDISKVLEHVRERMNSARTVDDLTWGPPIQHASLAEKEAYVKYRRQLIEFASKKKVQYREVMTFPNLERVKLAEERLDRNLPGYQLRYYETSPHPAAPPLARFIIIDDEVIFVQHQQASLPTEGVVWVSVTHPLIVKLAKVYLVEAWQGAAPVEAQLLMQLRNQMVAPAGGS